MRSRRLQRRMPRQTDSADWPCTSVTSSGELFEVLQQADDPVNVSTRFTRSRSRRRSPSSLERWLVVAPRRVSATLASWCGIRGHGDTGIILEHGRSKSETLAHAWLKGMERWAATCLLPWTCLPTVPQSVTSRAGKAGYSVCVSTCCTLPFCPWTGTWFHGNAPYSPDQQPTPTTHSSWDPGHALAHAFTRLPHIPITACS
jgi:hypothetical protein